MILRELLAILLALPPETLSYEVDVEGCDCIADAINAEVYADSRIIIRRADGILSETY